jgi:hypothetical protein
MLDLADGTIAQGHGVSRCNGHSYELVGKDARSMPHWRRRMASQWTI